VCEEHSFTNAYRLARARDLGAGSIQKN
jgi:hypothetical protein